MCLLIFAHQVSPQFPLVLAANRDEFHARPTRPSQFWNEHPGLLAGKDLEQGGTWMGITREGRFAAVTNYRDPDQTRQAPRSRGELPLQFLTGRQSPEEYLEALASRAGQYAGFNLLVGDAGALWYFANNGRSHPRELAPGLYGLSNANLDTPWPKVELGKARLQALLDDGQLEAEHIASLVADTHTARPEALARLGMETDMEEMLSAQFIITPGYGTRSTTALRMDADGQIHWAEESFDEHGRATGKVELALTHR